MADIEKKEIAGKEANSTAEKARQSKANAPKSKKSFKEKMAGIGTWFQKTWREYSSECKKIVWYSREQTFHSSVLVIVSIVVVAAIVSGLDYGFYQALLWLGRLV